MNEPIFSIAFSIDLIDVFHFRLLSFAHFFSVFCSSKNGSPVALRLLDSPDAPSGNQSPGISPSRCSGTALLESIPSVAAFPFVGKLMLCKKVGGMLAFLRDEKLLIIEATGTSSPGSVKERQDMATLQRRVADFYLRTTVYAQTGDATGKPSGSVRIVV